MVKQYAVLLTAIRMEIIVTHTANMKTIHKYVLGNKFGITEIPVYGEDIRVLDAGVQSPVLYGYNGLGSYPNEELYIWIMLDTHVSALEKIKIHVYGTGWEIPQDVELKHIRTVQIKDFVYHIFQEV